MKRPLARRGCESVEGRAVTVEFKSLIAKVATGAALARDEAAAAFEQMMSGEATPSQMGGLLMALRVRGESVDEITGAVSVMRAKMLRVHAPPDAIDVVGTGGDASGSFNISTCAALIVAGGGVPVAKHGNRALSSRSGAADVLSALGVNIELDVHAQCREHVGRPRARGEGAVAMLGDRHAAPCDDQGGAGGDIEGARGIAARPHHVDGIRRRP